MPLPPPSWEAASSGLGGQPSQDPPPPARCWCCLWLPGALGYAWFLGLEPQVGGTHPRRLQGRVLLLSVGYNPTLLPAVEGSGIWQSWRFSPRKTPKRQAGKKQGLLPSALHQLSACLGAQQGAGGSDANSKPPGKGHRKVCVALIGPNCSGQHHPGPYHAHEPHLWPHHPAAPPALAISWAPFKLQPGS